jgi:hypothetical protein
MLFESVWPRHKLKIDLVLKNIESHALLMTGEVNLEHIRQAYDARKASFEHYELVRAALERQDFERVVTHLSAKVHDDELYRILRTVCDGTGNWIWKDKSFLQWLDPKDISTKVLWLQGIPGAGK